MKTPEPIARALTPVSLLLVGILLLAAFRRFFMLSRIGISGSDTVYYLTIARGWIDAPENYRQVILGIYSLVLELGGDSDWSIKALNAGLDLFNVLLAFLIALRVSGRRRVALLTALAYALLPRAIAFSRTELLHAAATGVFLTSLAFLIWYLTTAARARRLVYLVLSGLWIGLGYGVHSDLMPFVPGMVGCVLLAACEGSARPGSAFRLRVRAALAHAAVFLAAAVSVMTPLGFWSELFQVRSRMPPTLAASPGAGAEAGTGLASISYPELFWNMLEFNSSPLVTFLFFSLLVAALVLALTARLRPLSRANQAAGRSARPIGVVGFASAILVCSYLLLYPFVEWYVDPRHFLAALPLVLMSLFVWMDWVMGLLLSEGRGRASLHALCALAVILENSWRTPTIEEMNARVPSGQGPRYHLSYARTVPERLDDGFVSSKYPISHYRVVYDLLRDEVDEHNRLLVAPYVLMSDAGKRRVFRHYFGDDAVYIEDCTSSLEHYVAERRVRYIVFAGFNYVPLTRTPVCAGLRRKDYTVAREWAALDSFLARRGGWKLLARNDSFFLIKLSEKGPLGSRRSPPSTDAAVR